MLMDYSQKVARFFEISGYLLMAPALIALFYSLALVLTGLLNSLLVFLLSLIPFLIFTLGITLFIGCFKHSRGNLERGKILPLWITTVVFNLIPLILTCIATYHKNSSQAQSYPQNDEPNIFLLGILVFWLLNICLAISAMWFEIEKRSLYERLDKTFPS